MNRFLFFMYMMAFFQVSGAQQLDCDVRKSGEIVFSSVDKKDTLHVRIEGHPCSSAVLTLRIVDTKGGEIYFYRSQFRDHIADDWSDANLNRVAETYVSNVFDDHHFSNTKELPKWEPGEKYFESNFQTLQVSKEYYEILLTRDWAVFSHTDDLKNWRFLVYDPNLRKAVVISHE